MAILKKTRFEDFQEVRRPDNIPEEYKNIYKGDGSLKEGKWVLAKLIEPKNEREGRKNQFYLLYEFDSSVKTEAVDAPEPPFNTGDGIGK